MHNLVRLLNLEFKRFRGIPVIALIFIMSVPLLYGGIYLDANWDLYGHIDQVNVAIVNKDKPVTYQGQKVDAGSQFETAIKQKDGFNWQFMDAAEAREELRTGKVYMIVTIPENFSENLVAAGEFKPQRATIEFRRDDANGFIAGSLLMQAQSVIQESVNSAVGEAYFTALFGALGQIRDGFQQAADGSAQLADGLTQATNGVSQIDAGLKNTSLPDLSDKLGKLHDALDVLDEGSTQTLTGLSGISGAVAELSGISSSLDVGTKNVEQALGPLRSYINSTLPSLKDNAASLADISANLTGGADGGVVGKVQSSLQTASDLVAKAEANPSLLGDSTFKAELQSALSAASKAQGDISAQLNAQGALTGNIEAQINYDAAKSAVDGADAALSALKGTTEEVAGSLDGIGQSAKTLQDGLGTLQQGKDQLNEVLGDFSTDSLSSIVSGVTTLTDAIARLDEAMPQLEKGANTLASSLNDGAASIPALTESDSARLSEIMSSPVSVKTIVDNDAQTYGRGLAPFFFSIALWVSTVTFFLVLRTFSGRTAASRSTPLRSLLYGFGPFALLGVGAALIMGIGVWLWLGINPVHPWRYLFFLVVVALSFFSLAYWVRLWLGSPQSAVFLVLLILQLPASGGTFPVAMLVPFYRAISVISPMRYSVEGFRVAISGGTNEQYWGAVAVLLGIVVVSMVIAYVVVRRYKVFSMRQLHPPMITSESTGDYAFSVRPR